MPYGSVGGMERLALNFYHYYKTKGYTVKAVKFIGLQSDIINFGDDEFVFSKNDLAELSSFKRGLFYLKLPFVLRKIIKTQNITHSIAFGDMANISSALTFTKEYKIGSIHALKSIELNSNSVFTKLIRISYRTLYKRLQKVVCISVAIKKDLIENCRYKFPENLKVIYNPHNFEQITALANEPLNNTNEEVLFNKKVILFLGRISVQKAPWHLINAFAILRNKHAANLVIVGDGDRNIIEYMGNLIQHHGLSDHVHFLGRKANPYKYLKKASVLALTSHFEGTPNVIVEANGLCIPVVSSNCTDGIAELMSLKKIEIQNEDNVLVEGGIITPNLYRGTLGIPKTAKVIDREELKFAEGLSYVLDKKHPWDNMAALTEKFRVEIVCEQYLEKL